MLASGRTQPWLVANSWLAVGNDWRLAVGGKWRLADGGWWRMVVVDGGWWLVAVGSGWRLGRRWRLVAVGGWRLAVGGPLEQSLRAVNKEKKPSSLRTPWGGSHTRTGPASPPPRACGHCSPVPNVALSLPTTQLSNVSWTAVGGGGGIRGASTCQGRCRQVSHNFLAGAGRCHRFTRTPTHTEMCRGVWDTSSTFLLSSGGAGGRVLLSGR